MHCDFLGSDGLQVTHMDALKPSNSKLVILTMMGGFFTKFATLAHGAPRHIGVHYWRTLLVGISSGVLIGLFDLLNPKYVCIIYACMMVLKYDYAAHRS